MVFAASKGARRGLFGGETVGARSNPMRSLINHTKTENGMFIRFQVKASQSSALDIDY